MFPRGFRLIAKLMNKHFVRNEKSGKHRNKINTQNMCEEDSGKMEYGNFISTYYMDFNLSNLKSIIFCWVKFQLRQRKLKFHIPNFLRIVYIRT